MGVKIHPMCSSYLHPTSNIIKKVLRLKLIAVVILQFLTDFKETIFLVFCKAIQRLLALQLVFGSDLRNHVQSECLFDR